MASRDFPTSDWVSGELPHGVNRDEFNGLMQQLVHRPAETGVTHAFLVVANGAVVAEWYGDGYTADSTLISWSIAKSITHALVGCAVDDGLLARGQNNLLPEWEHDGRRSITLHDLLTMRSGLAWVEDYVDGSTSDVIEMLFGDAAQVGDHASFAAAKSLVVTPGTYWDYSSGTTNILCRILANALGEQPGSHEAVSEFMDKRLFHPIGMAALPKFDKAGTFVGSSFVYATARNFARFGYLYLNGGQWNGRQIVSQDWVSDASRAVVIDPVSRMGYSTQWWTWPDDEGTMLGHGYDGQLLWVSPRRNVVLVHLGKTSEPHVDPLRHHVARIIQQFPA
jgi:CubicO group peptidase (beta-lactamase class C family)